jgi:hypothetical protein
MSKAKGKSHKKSGLVSIQALVSPEIFILAKEAAERDCRSLSQWARMVIERALREGLV